MVFSYLLRGGDFEIAPLFGDLSMPRPLNAP